MERRENTELEPFQAHDFEACRLSELLISSLVYSDPILHHIVSLCLIKRQLACSIGTDGIILKQIRGRLLLHCLIITLNPSGLREACLPRPLRSRRGTGDITSFSWYTDVTDKEVVDNGILQI